MFDATSFVNTAVTDAFDTVKIAVREDDALSAVLKSFKVRQTDSGQVVMDIYWIIDEESVREETGQAEPMVRQSVWLDIDENEMLDGRKGKNVDLGKLRAVLNQNTPGKPWAPNDLIGGMARVKVRHSIDKRDNETIQANVVAVSPM